MAVPTRDLHQNARRERFHPEHVTQRNCIDNGATEQVFGHLKDEFFRGQDWQTFESFKADLNAYITYWNTQRRQVKLKGLTPAEYRDQALQQAA